MVEKRFLTEKEIDPSVILNLRRIDLFDGNINNFFEANFSEFSLAQLNELFDAFGFHKDELFVFVDDSKAGFFAMQVPLRPFWTRSTPDNASASFSWFIDSNSQNKVFSISGIAGHIKPKHIIAARYEASPDTDDYQLKNFDIGISAGHKLDVDTEKLGLTDISQLPSAGLITKMMMKMTKNTRKFSLPSRENIYDYFIKGNYFPKVPSHLGVNHMAQPVK